MQHFDVIVVGAGAAGIMAAITAAKSGKTVLLLEKLSRIGAKLKATGGGRCNLTNTLEKEAFMEAFGRNGKFMMHALSAFDHDALQDFFRHIGVETHAPDGFHIFPVTHSSSTIIDALSKEMQRVGVTVMCDQKVMTLEQQNGEVSGVSTVENLFSSTNVVIATGGLGYPQLGAEGDGYKLAQMSEHKVTELYPAMMPLKSKERWVANCRADTLPKVELRIDLKKSKKVRAKGDLIFTEEGIRGPVVLDFAREITPLLKKLGEVPLLMNLTKGMSEDDLIRHFKRFNTEPVVDAVAKLLPQALSYELCQLAGVNGKTTYAKLAGVERERLVKLLAWTPLTIIGHEGFKMAMVTRGGVSLKEIESTTMQSRRVKGVYFCGEVVDLDGPCGGYNLQWSFASGFLAGQLMK